MQNHKLQLGVLQKREDGFVIVKVHNTEYQINNWYGTKKKFNISIKDLPIECEGKVVKFTGKLFNTRYKARNFEIINLKTKQK